MFNRFSLRLKLVLAFLFIAALMVVVCVYQINTMRQFSSHLENLIDHDIARINALQDIQVSSSQLSDRRIDYNQALMKKSADQLKLKNTLVTQIGDLKQKVHAYEKLAKDNPNNLPSHIINTIKSNSETISSLNNKLATSGVILNAEDQALLNKTRANFNQTISSAVNIDRHNIQEKSIEAITLANDRQFTIGMMAILFTVIAGVMGVITASRIGRSLALLNGGAERIANGDFSQTLNDSSRDEIGQVGTTFNRMAQRLRDSYQRLALEQQRDEAILKGMGEGVIAIDEHGRIVIINKIATQLLELGDEASVLQKPIQEAYPLYELGGKKDAKIPPSKRPSSVALKTGKQVEDVFLFHTQAGTKRQINIAASPFKVDGKVVGVVTILRDVTKEKEVDRMKTEFISLASHQLRTPLSAIKWFSEMLINGDAGKLKTEQIEFAKSIAESTERMIALVSSLLNISRIESGRIMIVPEPTDLKELVGGIVNDLKAKTEEKQQTLVISVHEGLPKISLDPRLVGQVYLNLLTNAIKYTPKGGEISVFISKKDDMVISQVTDNGYGIPKAQQERMFQKFFRATNAVKVETDGTGLGLYLIKAVVESGGGKIWFESEEGKGSTFWFTIPLAGMKPKEGEVTLDV